ncbi:MAG: DNA polymerase domain-containing protein [Lentisphaeria bacterium]|jgi:DNA polymerase elongation subunit (family B)
MSDVRIPLDELVPSRHARLVAAEPAADGRAVLYRRLADGTVAAETVPFQPWLLTAGEELAAKLPGVRGVRRLAGPGAMNVRVHFPDLPAYEAALAFLKKETGRTPSAAAAPYRVFGDLTQQLLALLPARLFRDLAFAELRRLQLDIETRTSPGFDFPNPERTGDEIVIIALRDSTGWEHCLAAPELDEAGMLRELVRLIRERDPDVVEGHNLFNFDLPYLAARAKRHKVRLDFGRDGSPMTARASRFSAGERTASFTRFDIHGRHVLDTYQLVQLYDASHRDLESYGLKAVARHFGVAAPDRTYVDAAALAAELARDPARVRRYAMDDVRETDALSRILSPSHFHQAQLVPFSYQNCVIRGSGMRIDALLTAGYLAEDAALPTPQPARPFQGALTEAVRAGVFHNVWHVDVASLYPSIIVASDLAPAADPLRLFPKMLKALREFRLAAKAAAKKAADPARREHFQALQASFKVLINSFYGYAGFAQGTFNDFDLAETVTARGREILQAMLDFLAGAQATVIELDTDGIYFGPPPGVQEPEAFLARLQAQLPPGIDVELDATYAAMFSYKSKNYALLDAAGGVALTGAALKSRGLEPFQRRYIKELAELLLTGRGAAAAALHRRYAAALERHELPLADLAQREVLSTSPKAYAEKLAKGETRRSAAYELALKSARPYEQGDQVAFYVTGGKKNVAVTDAAKLLQDAQPGERDENVPYYLDKLAKLHAKFAEFLPDPDAGGAPFQLG